MQLAVPVGYKHTLGFTFFSNGATIDNGLSYTENALMFGYAYRPFFHHLSLGVNMNWLYINQFDLNTQYRESALPYLAILW